MPIRILEYEIAIIKSALNPNKIENKNYKIPAVIPIVLYTGKKKWDAKNYIKEVQEQREGYKELEFGKFNLIDVNNYNKKELLEEESILSKAMLLEKKNDNEEISKNIEEIAEIVISNPKYTREEKEILITLIDIILRRKIGNDQANELIKKLKGGNKNMLVALERVDEENKRILNKGIRLGKKEGKLEGRLEGKLEDVKNMLKDNLPLEKISEYTGIPKEKIKKIVYKEKNMAK